MAEGPMAAAMRTQESPFEYFWVLERADGPGGDGDRGIFAYITILVA